MTPPSHPPRATHFIRWAASIVLGTQVFLAAEPSARAAEPAASEPRFRLDLSEVVEGCPHEQQVRALIVARLGFDPFAPDAKARIRIEFRRTDSRFEARIQRLDGDTLRGERTLHEPEDCGELAAASALAASILIDPLGALAKRRAERSQPPPDQRPTPAEDPFRPAPDKPPPEPSEPWKAFATANALVSIGTSTLR